MKINISDKISSLTKEEINLFIKKEMEKSFNAGVKKGKSDINKLDKILGDLQEEKKEYDSKFVFNCINEDDFNNWFYDRYEF